MAVAQFRISWVRAMRNTDRLKAARMSLTAAELARDDDTEGDDE